MDTLALGFWSRLPALRNYGVLTKLMLKLAVPHAEKGVVGKRKTMHADDDRQVETHAMRCKSSTARHATRAQAELRLWLRRAGDQLW